MRIQTIQDECFEINTLPDEIDEMKFMVLDNCDNTNPEFVEIPLIFLESFTCPALVLQIGKHQIKMPIDWSIVIGEEDVGDLEALQLTAINDREFNAFQWNSLSGFSPTFPSIEVVDVFTEVDWYAPKLRNGQYLCVPLEEGESPKCVYFIKDVTRSSEVIDYNNLW